MSDILELRQRVEAAEEKFGHFAAKQSKYSARLISLVTAVEGAAQKSQQEHEETKLALVTEKAQNEQLRSMLHTLLLAFEQGGDDIGPVLRDMENMISALSSGDSAPPASAAPPNAPPADTPPTDTPPADAPPADEPAIADPAALETVADESADDDAEPIEAAAEDAEANASETPPDEEPEDAEIALAEDADAPAMANAPGEAGELLLEDVPADDDGAMSDLPDLEPDALAADEEILDETALDGEALDEPGLDEMLVESGDEEPLDGEIMLDAGDGESAAGDGALDAEDVSGLLMESPDDSEVLEEEDLVETEPAEEAEPMLTEATEPLDVDQVEALLSDEVEDSETELDEIDIGAGAPDLGADDLDDSDMADVDMVFEESIESGTPPDLVAPVEDDEVELLASAAEPEAPDVDDPELTETELAEFDLPEPEPAAETPAVDAKAEQAALGEPGSSDASAGEPSIMGMAEQLRQKNQAMADGADHATDGG